MLILERYPKEIIRIGTNIIITILAVKGIQVRCCMLCPKNIPIRRLEVARRMVLQGMTLLERLRLENQTEEIGNLVITRMPGEGFLIGPDITVTILQVKGFKVRVGIDAPRSIPVHRQEIFARLQAEAATHPQ